MAPDREVVTALKAYVDTPNGMIEVRRGQPLPDDALDGEADRLRGLGAIGVPAEVTGEDSGD